MTTELYGITPVGRVISHAIFTPSKTGYKGRVLETPEFYIRLAVPKTTSGLTEFFKVLQDAARAGFSNKEWERPDFAWKCKDGDAVENKSRSGFPGCFVFRFSTFYRPQHIVDQENNPILDAGRIKPGYQVQVAYSAKANGDTEKPSVYLNFNMVKLIAVDTEIISGPSPMEVFGVAPPPLPLQPDVPVAPGAQAPAVPPIQQAPAVPPTSPFSADPAFLQVPEGANKGAV